VVVLARIGSSDDHDDEIVLLEDLLVADGRPQLLPVFVDPALQVECGQ
jgi:hypothetical protein